MRRWDPLVIEVRINEWAMRTTNPNLPYSPKEIVDQAVLAWEAGASTVHWHGREPETGAQRNDVELYLEVYQGLRERTDLLMHPTLGYMTQSKVEDRVRHILAVSDDPRLRVDMVPVDFGSVNVDDWDMQAKRFLTNDKVYVNSRANLEAALRIFRDHDVFVTAFCWEIGHIRCGRCFQEMGLLSRDTLWQLHFTGDALPSGATPTLPSLQAMVAEIPEGQHWQVINSNGDVMPLAAWAITMGGHVAIGLGDYHYSRFGSPNHGDLVRMIADMAHTLGRPIATPSQTREMLKMKARPDLPQRPVEGR